MSVNNALVVEKTKRFCLLIDPQMQGITWLKNQFDDAGTLTVIKQNDAQFKKLIEIAIDMGRTVIVEQIGEKVTMNLQSLMKKQVSKYGGSRMIEFCRKSYKYDKNFKLFVVSGTSSQSHPCQIEHQSAGAALLQPQILSYRVNLFWVRFPDQYCGHSACHHSSLPCPASLT